MPRSLSVLAYLSTLASVLTLVLPGLVAVALALAVPLGAAAAQVPGAVPGAPTAPASASPRPAPPALAPAAPTSAPVPAAAQPATTSFRVAAADARALSRTLSSLKERGDAQAVAQVLEHLRSSTQLHINRTFRFDPPLRATLQGPSLVAHLRREIEDRSMQARFGVEEFSHSCEYFNREDGRAVETCRRFPAGALEPIFTYTVFGRDERGVFIDTKWVSSQPLF
jgi:hypothetical protein